MSDLQSTPNEDQSPTQIQPGVVVWQLQLCDASGVFIPAASCTKYSRDAAPWSTLGVCSAEATWGRPGTARRGGGTGSPSNSKDARS
jgi:hypothetical protein